MLSQITLAKIVTFDFFMCNHFFSMNETILCFSFRKADGKLLRKQSNFKDQKLTLGMNQKCLAM